jgi:hypothetical protein
MLRKLSMTKILFVTLIIFAIPALACGPSAPKATATPTTAPTAPPAPTTASLPSGCQPVDLSAGQSSGIIEKVTMALNTQGDAKDPVDPTTVFKPTSVIHAVLGVKDAPANTVFKAAWFATDVGNVAPCNTSIDTSEITTDGTRNVDFYLSPSSQWPDGKYRVEISVNGKLDQIVEYTVKQ